MRDPPALVPMVVAGCFRHHVAELGYDRFLGKRDRDFSRINPHQHGI